MTWTSVRPRSATRLSLWAATRPHDWYLARIRGPVARGAETRRGGDRGRRIALSGTVQGVGFRPFVYRVAHETGVAGRVRNDAAGVTIEAFGPAAALDAFVARLRAEPPAAAVIAEPCARSASRSSRCRGFEIVESGGAAERRAAIPPDLATCDDCLREVRDPRDRRHRYPFTNCTGCGPRFTIALGAPYDRPATTMAGFRMCPACAREYGDPARPPLPRAAERLPGLRTARRARAIGRAQPVAGGGSRSRPPAPRSPADASRR